MIRIYASVEGHYYLRTIIWKNVCLLCRSTYFATTSRLLFAMYILRFFFVCFFSSYGHLCLLAVQFWQINWPLVNEASMGSNYHVTPHYTSSLASWRTGSAKPAFSMAKGLQKCQIKSSWYHICKCMYSTFVSHTFWMNKPQMMFFIMALNLNCSDFLPSCWPFCYRLSQWF